jgi:uncharacterized repeat protein (TIGR01451 family)
VFLVPELQPFVTVRPVSFSSIQKNVTYAISLTTTIPLNSPLGVPHLGTISLKTGGLATQPNTFKLSLEVVSAGFEPVNVAAIKQDTDGSTFEVNRLIVGMRTGSTLQNVYAVAGAVGGAVLGGIPAIGLYQLQIPGGSIADLLSAAQLLLGFPQVLSAHPDYVGEFASSNDLAHLDSCFPGVGFTAAYDKVRLQRAYDLITAVPSIGLHPVTVGVVDTGVDFNHWEFQGVNLVSDPVNLLESLTPSFIGNRQHGTAVTGIIGANNLGPLLDSCNPIDAIRSKFQMNGIVAGIPGLQGNYKLVSLGNSFTVSTAGFRGLLDVTHDTQALITRLGDQNRSDRVPVVNLSFSLPRCGALSSLSPCIKNTDFQTISDEYRSLFRIYSDMLFVIAAGNKGIAAADAIPANADTPNSLTIAATGIAGAADDQRLVPALVAGADPSNFSPGVNLAAPGQRVYTTNLHDSTANVFGITLPGYWTFGETSAATAMVAGVAAMIFATNGDIGAETLKGVIVNSADQIADQSAGGRRLNACRAVRRALGFPAFQLNSSNPANGATGVSVASSMFLTFSAPVDTLQIASTLQVFASNNTQPQNGTVLVLNNQSVEFIPSQALQPGIAYLVDLRNVADICGDRLGGSTAVTFTTAFAVIPPPDLTISKTASPSPVTGGGTLTYTLTAQNATGTTDALNVTVTDALPSGVSFTSCSVSTGGCSTLNGTVTALFGTLAGGASATLTITTKAPTVTSSTTITNMATVSTTNPESNTANNQASATTVINLPVATFVQLTNTMSRVVQQQVLSRDGSKLAFVSTADLTGQNPLGREALFVINSDGTGTTQLAVSPLNYDPNRSPSFAGGPSLSGDGSKVAFALLTASLGTNLWVINSDGTGVQLLATSSAFFLGSPSISSDGTKIAFFIQNRIEIINSDGTGNSSLVFLGVATPPFISGDGSKVFFVASSEIFSVNADGTSLFQVTHLSQFGPFVRPASLSVDGLGHKVTFIDSTGNLEVINSDGTGLFFVDTVGILSFASISDDGRKIAYSSPFNWDRFTFGPEQIYLIDVNGGNRRQITSVASFGCFRPKLDATGTRVSFLSSADLTGQNADNSPELFLANVTPP